MPNPWFVKVTLLLASTLTVMAGATIAPSLPAMQTHFADVANVDFWVKLVLTVPALAIVIGSPIAGQMVDVIGRKPLLIGSAILYGLAGGSGFVLDSLFAILGGRVLLGLAVAGVMVSATTLIADYFSGDQRANFMGLQAAFMGFGGVLFLSGGGFVADLNWRLPFLIYLFAWLLLPLMVWSLYEPERASAPSHDSDNRSATLNRLPIKLLVTIYGAALLMQVVFYMIPTQLPFHLQQISGADATRSGLAIALATFFSAISSLNYGKVKQHLNFINILALAFTLMGLGYMGIGLVNTYGLVLLMLIPTGLGLGLLMPNLNVWTSREVPDHLRGRALGGLTTFFFLGQFLSPVVTQPMSQGMGLMKTYGLSGLALVVVGAILWTSRKQICRLLASAAGQT